MTPEANSAWSLCPWETLGASNHERNLICSIISGSLQAHSHRATVPSCDKTPSQPHRVGGKQSQSVSSGSPVGEYPPLKETSKSTHARRRPGKGATSDTRELCERRLIARVEGLEATLMPRHVILSTPPLRKNPVRHPQGTLRSPPLRAHGGRFSGGRSRVRTPLSDRAGKGCYLTPSWSPCVGRVV